MNPYLQIKFPSSIWFTIYAFRAGILESWPKSDLPEPEFSVTIQTPSIQGFAINGVWTLSMNGSPIMEVQLRKDLISSPNAVFVDHRNKPLASAATKIINQEGPETWRTIYHFWRAWSGSSIEEEANNWIPQIKPSKMYNEGLWKLVAANGFAVGIRYNSSKKEYSLTKTTADPGLIMYCLIFENQPIFTIRTSPATYIGIDDAMEAYQEIWKENYHDRPPPENMLQQMKDRIEEVIDWSRKQAKCLHPIPR